MTQPLKTITLDGVEYPIEKFSQGVQQAAAIYSKFSEELAEQQLQVMKTQAALQQISQQITEAVKRELAPQKPAE